WLRRTTTGGTVTFKRRTRETELQGPKAQSREPKAGSEGPKAARLMNASASKGAVMSSAVNVAGVERWASAIGGAALAAYALKQLKERSPAGAMLAAAGTALIYRGATGHCAMYEAAGIDRAAGSGDTRRALGGSRGVRVEESFT